jgi:hypothetical protein
MALNAKLEDILSKTYMPDSRIDQIYNGKDLTFVTNEFGEPVTLFIGRRKDDGAIAGERYVRRITRKPDSNDIQRSHWELKGKVSRSS